MGRFFIFRIPIGLYNEYLNEWMNECGVNEWMNEWEITFISSFCVYDEVFGWRFIVVAEVLSEGKLVIWMLVWERRWRWMSDKTPSFNCSPYTHSNNNSQSSNTTNRHWTLVNDRVSASHLISSHQQPLATVPLHQRSSSLDHLHE